MALKHLQAGQVTDINAFGGKLGEQKTATLFKAKHLEVIRLVLQKNQTLPPHKVPGDITIHCIEGRITVSMPSRSVILLPGQMVFLDAELQHGLLALEPSSALVTISLTSAER